MSVLLTCDGVGRHLCKCQRAHLHRQNQMSGLRMWINRHYTPNSACSVRELHRYMKHEREWLDSTGLCGLCINVHLPQPAARCACMNSAECITLKPLQSRERVFRGQKKQTLSSPSACPCSPTELSAGCCFPLQQMAMLIWFHSTLIGK